MRVIPGAVQHKVHPEVYRLILTSFAEAWNQRPSVGPFMTNADLYQTESAERVMWLTAILGAPFRT